MYQVNAHHTPTQRIGINHYNSIAARAAKACIEFGIGSPEQKHLNSLLVEAKSNLLAVGAVRF